MPIGIRAARARPLRIRRLFRPEVKYHLEPDEWRELATYRNCLPQTELTYRLIVLVPCISRCAGTAIHYLDPPAQVPLWVNRHQSHPSQEPPDPFGIDDELVLALQPLPHLEDPVERRLQILPTHEIHRRSKSFTSGAWKKGGANPPSRLVVWRSVQDCAATGRDATEARALGIFTSLRRIALAAFSCSRRWASKVFNCAPLFLSGLVGAVGIEPIANSLSPVESVGLTLLEDLIWA